VFHEFINNVYLSADHGKDNNSFLGVTTRLWLIGLWNPHKIVSATVNLNSIDLSRHFASAISAPKAV
jgi:hypothetical protein